VQAVLLEQLQPAIDHLIHSTQRCHAINTNWNHVVQPTAIT
jgi:hypothetical protein